MRDEIRLTCVKDYIRGGIHFEVDLNFKQDSIPDPIRRRFLTQDGDAKKLSELLENLKPGDDVYVLFNPYRRPA